jgi:hypothetical protein
MKGYLVIIVIILLIIVSGITGYFIKSNQQKSAMPETVIVHDQDLKILKINDSLTLYNILYMRQVDSLKNVLKIYTSKNHEEIVHRIDSIPAPDLFREISECFLRQ